MGERKMGVKSKHVNQKCLESEGERRAVGK